MKMNSLRAGGLAALLVSSSLGLTACGEVPDTVFLYFINGYPGTSGVTVIGEGGVIVEDAEFGDRIGEGGACPVKPNPAEDPSCIPIEVDRKFGPNLTILLDGSTQPASASFNLYAMYPQETGTVILSRKSSESSVDMGLFRHVQSISSGCTFTMSNGLAVSDEFLSSTSYLIAPEFRVEPVEQAGFSDETSLPFISPCGPLPTDAPEHNSLNRGDTIASQVADNPWFFAVPCPEDNGSSTAVCFAWGIPGVDDRAVVGTNGEVRTLRNTFDYYQCVQDAITLLPTEEQMMSPFPIPADQIQCPDGQIQWDDVKVDFEAVQECNFPILQQAINIPPTINQSLHFYSTSDGFFCDFEFRARAGGLDGIFGPDADGNLGRHGDGQLVTSQIEVNEGSEHFWVPLGRPVNPIVWQWDSGTHFVDLNPSSNSEGYPYPNDGNDIVGVYDYEGKN